MTNYFKYKPCQHSNSTYTYTYYEWIEVSSSLFTIDYYPCDKTIIDIKYIPYNHTDNFVLGAKGDSLNGEHDVFRFFSFSLTSNFYLDYGSGMGYNRINGGECVLNTLYNLQLGNRYIRDLDTGEDIISGPVVTFDRKTYPINIGDGQFKGKYYSIKIYEDDVLLLNLRPCKRSDGVRGFYDTINNKFYTNTKPDIPTVGFDNYTQWDYLSDGPEGGYIITDYFGKNNSSYVFEYKKMVGINPSLSGSARAIFSVGRTNADFGISLVDINSQPVFYINGSQYVITWLSPHWHISITPKKLSLKELNDRNPKIYLRTIVNSWNGSDSASLLLFRTSTNGRPAEGAMFYFNVYEDNIMVRNYIPVTNSEGEAGMLDTVNMVFWGSSGPGTLIVGNEE